MEQFFKDFALAISPALQILIQSVALAAITALTAWLKSKWDSQKLDLSREQQYLLEVLASSAVSAAKQVESDNESRLAYAFDIVEKSLKNYGVVIDIDVIYSAIESKVFEQKTPQG